MTTKEILELAGSLQLSESVIKKLQNCLAKLDWAEYAAVLTALIEPSTAEAAAKQLSETSTPIVELSVQLGAAVLSWEKIYQPRKIAKSIYLASMKAFARFLKERMQNFNDTEFDRGFWTWRFLCGREFRIGELEYEVLLPPYSELFAAAKKQAVIAIHIPSDARLTPVLLQESYQQAASFWREKFPELPYAYMATDTWLLSPVLQTLLPPSANIRTFAKDYRIIAQETESDQAAFWIFGDTSRPLSEWPERTTLQKNTKKLIEKGGHIGSAVGILIS